MKYLRSALKIIFWVLIFALLVAPVGLLVNISQAEMATYEPPAAPVIRETSMGTPRQAVRMDVKEHITVNGQFTSNEIAFQQLPQEQPDKIRWIVGPGQEIQVGQVLGYHEDQPVAADMDGILEAIHANSGDAYLKIRLFSPLEFEATVSETVLSALKRGGDQLHLADGTAVRLTYAANAQNADGSTNIRLVVDNNDGAYGEAMTLLIYTGLEFPNALVVQSNCVYQKNGQWYVRKVTESGSFVAEMPVQVSYDDGSFACVSGINEGEWFDSGYKAIMGGDGA